MGWTAKRWRAIGLGLLPLCLAACAAAYVAPPDADAASVDVIDQGAGHVTVYTFKDGTDCSGRSELADLSGGEHRRTAMPPDRELVMSFSYINGAGICSLSIGFVPDKGKTYRVYTGLESQDCYVRVLQALGNGRGEGPVSIRRRTMHSPLFSSGSWCRAD